MTGKAAHIATIVTLICVVGGTIARAQTDSGVQQATASALPDSSIESIAPSAEKSKGFLLWMDNSLTILPYGWNYKVDPSEQTTFSFEHVRESAIGDFFGFVDVTSFQGTNGSGAEELASRIRFNTDFAHKLADEFRPSTTAIVTDQPAVRNPIPDSTYFAAN